VLGYDFRSYTLHYIFYHLITLPSLGPDFVCVESKGNVEAYNISLVISVEQVELSKDKPG
jgi:hypothetical protein